jgi:hypothetical protein
MPIPVPVPIPVPPPQESAVTDEDDASEPVEITEDTDGVLPPETIRKPEPAASAAKPLEKPYFGKTALILCLIAIGVLSIACGVFATLYFGEIL